MAEWSVDLVVDVGHEIDGDTLAELGERLEAHVASVGEEPEPGRLGVQMHTEAPSIRKGLDAAVRAVTDALRAVELRGEVIDARVMTAAEFERQQMCPTLPPLMGLAEVAEFLGVSRQRVNQLVKENPQYFREVVRTASGPLYAEAAVSAFKARRRRPGRPPKTEAPAAG